MDRCKVLLYWIIPGIIIQLYSGRKRKERGTCGTACQRSPVFFILDVTYKSGQDFLDLQKQTIRGYEVMSQIYALI